jgi:hypothetical protein
MANYRKPGVYVEESLLVGSADTSSATSTALFVGVAGSGPVDRSIRCETWSDYVMNFGGFDEVVDPGGVKYLSYLPYAVYSYFQNGGRPAYIQRAAGSNGVAAGYTVVDGDALSASVTQKRANPTTVVRNVITKELTDDVATLTTSVDHGFVVGQSVVVDGVDATFDGTYTITAVSANTFSYDKTDSDVTAASATGTATITTGVTATLTTSSAHGFEVGRLVSVASVDSTFNGSHTITAVGSTTFSFALPSNTVTTGITTNQAVAPSGSATIIPRTSFSVTASSVGTLGNTLSITVQDVGDPNSNVFTLTVFKDGVEMERFQYLTMDGETPGTKRLDSAVNDPYSGSALIDVVTYNSDALPAPLVSLTSLTGGADPSLPDASDFPTVTQGAVAKIDSPLIINQVGYTSNKSDPDMFVAPTPVTKQAHFTDRGDVFIINDSVRPRKARESSSTYRTAISSNLGQGTGDSYVAAYSPWIIIQNPKVSGATITIPPGGGVAGVMSRIDTSIGVFRAPAGIIASINNAVGVDTKYTDTDLGDLNSSNINAIRSVAGTGIAIMGARTRKLYGADRYVSARRTLIYIKEYLRRSTAYALFENNDNRLWSQLSQSAERLLRPLWEAGGLRGLTAQEAYYVKCDETLNTPAVISSGEVRMEIGVALEYPAEFIIIRVTQFESGGFSAEVQPRS